MPNAERGHPAELGLESFAADDGGYNMHPTERPAGYAVGSAGYTM